MQKKAVLRWCTSQINSTRVTETWRDGWLKGKANDKKAKVEPHNRVELKREATTEVLEHEDLTEDPEIFLDEESPCPPKKSKPSEEGSDDFPTECEQVKTSDSKSHAPCRGWFRRRQGSLDL